MNRNLNKSVSKIKSRRFKKEIQWIFREKYSNESGRVKIKEEDIARLEKGEPVDYIIGSVPFLNVTIDLSCRPLIPRPETEYWTHDAVEYIKSMAARPGRGDL